MYSAFTSLCVYFCIYVHVCTRCFGLIYLFICLHVYLYMIVILSTIYYC